MSMNEASCEAWRSALLPEDSTLKDAISCLDRSSMQVAIVINGNGRLVGTLTDGDIRRGLLRGLELSSPVAGIIHRDPIVVPPQWGRDMVLQLMQANKVHQLPVVDDERRVVGLHVWDELLAPARRPNVMVIMAGGSINRGGVVYVHASQSTFRCRHLPWHYLSMNCRQLQMNFRNFDATGHCMLYIYKMCVYSSNTFHQ